MTTSKLNPFPVYTVARFVDDPKATAAATVATEPILEARRRVEAYAGGFASTGDGPPSGSINAVRGDPGTGKTHLLVDAAQRLRELRPDATVLRFTCTETDPLEWFRTKVGPQLDQLFLKDAVISLLARSGAKVAQSAPLTEAAAARLRENPAAVLELIRLDRLNATAVQRDFEAGIRSACPEATENVLRALSAVAWAETETPAREWLAGRSLSQPLRDRLRVSEQITDPVEAAAVLGAVAALHGSQRRPLAILIDELEQFARHDSVARTNITWLKRLLETFGGLPTLVFVAGQWQAWHTTSDYLDRFPQYGPIDMLKLDAADVGDMLATRAPSASLSEEQRRTIAEVTRGNIRRIMSLCGALFRLSDGFATAISVAQIRATWDQLAKTVPRERVLDEVRASLAARGLVVEVGAQVGGIPFDLVASRNGAPVVLIQAVRGVHQAEFHDAARLFLDQVGSVADKAPSVVGYFLAEGNVDDELLSLLRAGPESRIHWFDLAEPGAVPNVIASLDALVGPATNRTDANEGGETARNNESAVQASGASQGSLEDLRAAQEAFRHQVQGLELRRLQEVAELNHRLAMLAERATPRTSVVVDQSASTDLVRMTYDEVMREPSFMDKLRTLGWLFIMQVLSIALGTYIATNARMLVRADESHWPEVRFGVVCVVCGAGTLWFCLIRIEEYVAYSRRLLRDLYLRKATAGDLAQADAVLRRGMRSATWVSAWRYARKNLGQLSWQSAEVADYLSKRVSA